MIKNDVTHANLGYDIIAIQQQFMTIASLIKELSGKSTSVIESTHRINVANLCSGNNDVHHVREEVLNGLDRQIKYV
jgi:hypothetical protein